MAKIGLSNFRYSILTEAVDGTPSYAGAKTPAKAVSCTVDISNNNAMLYADDSLVESYTGFQSGTVTMGIDEDDLETMADLLGHTVSNGEMIRNANDTAPYVGLGRIVTKMVNGSYKYKVEFLYKVKFAEPSQENNTKGESVEFATTEIEGTVSTLESGKWSVAQSFDTKEDALTYLEGLMAAQSVTVTEVFENISKAQTITLSNIPKHGTLNVSWLPTDEESHNTISYSIFKNELSMEGDFHVPVTVTVTYSTLGSTQSIIETFTVPQGSYVVEGEFLTYQLEHTPDNGWFAWKADSDEFDRYANVRLSGDTITVEGDVYVECTLYVYYEYTA